MIKYSELPSASMKKWMEKLLQDQVEEIDGPIMEELSNIIYNFGGDLLDIAEFGNNTERPHGFQDVYIDTLQDLKHYISLLLKKSFLLGFKSAEYPECKNLVNAMVDREVTEVN